MKKKELQDKLDELKSDYVRIQSDLDKLVYVRGRASSAQEQLARIEDEIAEVYKKLEAFE
ncbi:SE1832 family protein [Ornithinibacillus sp. 179-J 7C1 HS]|uniref:SE1832 family protein n=1 Tax=Ornithinibacillus sp. 179-J 7C1 HS TaxID=3142384 RepID=UPI00399F47D9